jgi:hypothetical protein
MPAGVVDELELIQLEVQHGVRRPAGRRRDRARELRLEARAVEQVGQRIMLRVERELPAQRAFRRRVAQDDHAAGLRLAVEGCRGDEHGHLAARASDEDPQRAAQAAVRRAVVTVRGGIAEDEHFARGTCTRGARTPARQLRRDAIEILDTTLGIDADDAGAEQIEGRDGACHLAAQCGLARAVLKSGIRHRRIPARAAAAIRRGAVDARGIAVDRPAVRLRSPFVALCRARRVASGCPSRGIGSHPTAGARSSFGAHPLRPSVALSARLAQVRSPYKLGKTVPVRRGGH